MNTAVDRWAGIGRGGYENARRGTFGTVRTLVEYTVGKRRQKGALRVWGVELDKNTMHILHNGRQLLDF